MDLKILNTALFKQELEWGDALSKAHGPINEKLISHCDRWRLANTPKDKVSIEAWDATNNFIVNVLKDFSIDICPELRENIENHFLLTQPNYYTIKDYILKIIISLKNKLDIFENKKLPEAACVLIINDKNELLMVTRKKNKELFGLPGGKVDFGETPIQAAARELKEETGYIINEENLEHIFSMIVNGYMCWCYTIVDEITKKSMVLQKEKFQIKELEAGVIPTFIHISDLLEVSEFKSYNAAAFESFAEYVKAHAMIEE